MPVSFEREDFKLAKKQYELIADCLAGETQVKTRRQFYLPHPAAYDPSKDAKNRYDAYLRRAVFYNVTNRTMRGMQGQIFAREPVAEVPDALDAVLADATGLGVSVNQLAEEGVAYNLAYGRGGFLVDFPPATEGGYSRADVAAGRVRPYINVYKAQEIINWRTAVMDGVDKLSLVVLAEPYEIVVDTFAVRIGKLYRVFRLVDGVVEASIYTHESGTPSFVYRPTKPNGEPWSVIPFGFFGSVNNDPKIDYAPLYDMASLNIAHYRNSADYEESSFLAGQPTPVFSGLTEHWVKEVLKGEIVLGSRAAVALPEGANAQLLQAEPNTMPFEAMQHKERQMVALGAKLVEQAAVQRTATEAGIESASENSVLSTIAKNTGAAMRQALLWAHEFIAPVTPEIERDFKYTLNTDFQLAKLTPDERRTIIEEWQKGAITFTEMRAVLRKGGVATLDDAAARAEIQQDMLDLMGDAGDDDDDDNQNSGGGDE